MSDLWAFLVVASIILGLLASLVTLYNLLPAAEKRWHLWQRFTIWRHRYEGLQEQINDLQTRLKVTEDFCKVLSKYAEQQVKAAEALSSAFPTAVCGLAATFGRQRLRRSEGSPLLAL